MPADIYTRAGLKQKQETIEDTYIDGISKESPIWIENNNLLDWLKVFK